MGDLLAVPDPATLTPLPWRPEVGWLSCNLVHNGTDLDHGPRNVLRRVVAALEAEGLAMKVGVECEFFLLDAPGPNEPPGAAPRIGDRLDTQSKPCYDSHALMRRWAPDTGHRITPPPPLRYPLTTGSRAPPKSRRLPVLKSLPTAGASRHGVRQTEPRWQPWRPPLRCVFSYAPTQ
jgi:hypothetical protein